MELLKNCRKAEIYTLSNQFLCEAEVFRDMSGSVWLSVPNDFSLEPDAGYLITFFDPHSGLIHSRCSLSKADNQPSPHWISLLAVIEEVIDTQQRRQDVKISLEIALDLTIVHPSSGIPGIPDAISASTRNLSAGGVYFICEYPIPPSAEVEFLLHGASKPLILTAKILRQEKLPSTADNRLQYGHGCQFINLKPQNEASLRNYIFRQERQSRL